MKKGKPWVDYNPYDPEHLPESLKNIPPKPMRPYDEIDERYFLRGARKGLENWKRKQKQE